MVVGLVFLISKYIVVPSAEADLKLKVSLGTKSNPPTPKAPLVPPTCLQNAITGGIKDWLWVTVIVPTVFKLIVPLTIPVPKTLKVL